VKLTKSKLKELIKKEILKKSLEELKFGSKAQYDAYKKKHHIKPGTEVSVGDKKFKEKGKKKEKMVRNAAGDMVPASSVAGHPDFKSAAEKSGKPHPGERDPSVRKSREKGGDDSGGPSYANVPKGAKSSKQAKLMKKNDSVAKKMFSYFSTSSDLVKYGDSDDIGEFMNKIPDMGQDFEKADELLNLVRDNEQAMRSDDEDVIDDYKKGILKILNTPGKGGSGKSGKDIEKQSMKAADDANAKMDRAEKAQELKNDILRIKAGNQGWDDIAKSKEDAIKVLQGKIKKLQSESIKESKKRRYTVKEVRMWMKKLEENRYKKVYNSDARRVAWLANNNLSEDYESMPISMRKKWSKAAYGRERYLAKEFLKSKLDQLKEQLEEQKLKESIKKIVFRMLNEGGPGSGPHKDDEDNPFDKEPTDDELADIEKEFEGVKKEGKLNETLPALAKEYTQYQKAEKLYIQSIRKLAMKAGRVEKVYDKQIMHSLKVFLGKGMNQFQNAVKDVLDKLQ